MNKTKLLMMAAAMALLSVPAFAQDNTTDAPEKGMGMMGHGEAPRAEMMFEKMDADGDGTVTEADFMAHAKERFAKIDANGDGKLTKEEMIAHHKEMREKRHEKMKEFHDGHNGGMGDMGAPDEEGDTAVPEKQ